MRVELPDEVLPGRFLPEDRLSDDEFWKVCEANPDVRVERTAEGELVFVPPPGGESDYQSLESAGELRHWAKRDGRGRVFGSSAVFILPTMAAYSPDAAWVSNERLGQLSKGERRKFLRLCPEFVIEVMSPSDRLRKAKEKMQAWMRGGVELAWLIHGDEQTVYVYRAGQAEPEVLTRVSKVAGEGPVAGFELDLTEIWAGL